MHLFKVVYVYCDNNITASWIRHCSRRVTLFLAAFDRRQENTFISLPCQWHCHCKFNEHSSVIFLLLLYLSIDVDYRRKFSEEIFHCDHHMWIYFRFVENFLVGFSHNKRKVYRWIDFRCGKVELLCDGLWLVLYFIDFAGIFLTRQSQPCSISSTCFSFRQRRVVCSQNIAHHWGYRHQSVCDNKWPTCCCCCDSEQTNIRSKQHIIYKEHMGPNFSKSMIMTCQ